MGTVGCGIVAGGATTLGFAGVATGFGLGATTLGFGGVALGLGFVDETVFGFNAVALRAVGLAFVDETFFAGAACTNVEAPPSNASATNKFRETIMPASLP